jgi:hypothetical protein
VKRDDRGKRADAIRAANPVAERGVLDPGENRVHVRLLPEGFGEPSAVAGARERCERAAGYSAPADWTLQVLGMLPTPAVDTTVVPFMNQIAVLPLASAHMRSLVPLPS